MATKIKNKRCPLQNECGRKCENVGTEIECDYYRNNGIGDNAIPDQEELREQMERSKANKDYESEIAELMKEEDEAIAENKLVYIPVDELYAHPDNPRKDLGDLSELADSIKAKGVMQNLTVVKGHFEVNGLSREMRSGGYTVIIGHRRMGAAKIAGLKELPCVIVEMSHKDQIATMLLENMQRSDLTVFEQAQGFQMMMDFGESIDSISEKTGFSQTTVRRRLKMAELNQETLKKVSDRQLSLMDFDRLAEITDITVRNKVLSTIGTNNFENEFARAINEQKKSIRKMCWIEELEKYNATEIPEKDKWDNVKYRMIGYRTVEQDPVETLKEDFAGDGPFYYCFDSWGAVYLRAGKPQEEVDEETAKRTEYDRKEEELRQIKSALEDAFDRAYTTRYDFVKNVSEAEAKKHIADIARFMASICQSQYTDFEDTDFAKLMNFDIPTREDAPDCEDDEAAENACAEVAYSSPCRSLLAVAYVLAEDDERSTCFSWDGSYRKSEKLNRLYGFLSSLGYEMSDEEAEILSGESNLYVKRNPEPTKENHDADDEEFEDEELFEDEDSENDEPGDEEFATDDVVEKLKGMYGAEE